MRHYPNAGLRSSFKAMSLLNERKKNFFFNVRTEIRAAEPSSGMSEHLLTRPRHSRVTQCLSIKMRKLEARFLTYLIE